MEIAEISATGSCALYFRQLEPRHVYTLYDILRPLIQAGHKVHSGQGTDASQRHSKSI